MKIVVYTGISNRYDLLRTPAYIDKNIDYICFTDDQYLKSNVWQIRVNKNENRIDKKAKILPHLFLEDYDISIWVDANAKISRDIIPLLQYIENKNMALFKHPNNRNLKQEFEICRKQKKANVIHLEKQEKEYNSYLNTKIMACGVLIRRHNDKKVIETMENWFTHINRHTYRDQLSFPVVADRNQLEYNIIDLNIFNNKFFHIPKNHKR